MKGVSRGEVVTEVGIDTRLLQEVGDVSLAI